MLILRRVRRYVRLTKPRCEVHVPVPTNLGFEGGFDLGGVRVENRMRYSDLSGRFVGVFPFDVQPSATYTIASGPSKGQSWTGIAAKVAMFNTELNDLG